MLSNYRNCIFNTGNNLKFYQVLYKSRNNVKCNTIFFRNYQFGNKKKVFNERKLVGFSMEQMYTVVSDVRNYKNFLPFCKKSNILQESPEYLEADLVIGFPPIIESYKSNVSLVKPKLVRSICTDGKLFEHLNTTWKFSPALKNNPQTCIIDFYISFEFRSILYSNLAHLVFDALVRQMETAFITEARARYGKESVRIQRLDVKRAR